MQMGQGVEWAVHCCTLLALVPADRTLPAARLAEYHDVPPAYLAKHLQAMAAGGLVESTPGRNGGYRLPRPAAGISMLDVIRAVEGSEPAFKCTEIRRRGPARGVAADYKAPCGIAAAMARAEEAWQAELARVSIADLLVHVAATVSPVSIRKAAGWFQEALN